MLWGALETSAAPQILAGRTAALRPGLQGGGRAQAVTCPRPPPLRHSALRATFAVRLRRVRGRQSQRAPSFLLPCWRPSLYSLWDALGEPDICHGWAAPPEILLQRSERQLGQLGEVTALVSPACSRGRAPRPRPGHRGPAPPHSRCWGAPRVNSKATEGPHFLPPRPPEPRSR